MFQLLRTFLLGIVPVVTPPFEVLRAQQNRVAPPKGQNYIIMTPLFKRRLSTTVDTYSDGYPNAPGYRYSEEDTEVTVQIDCYGPLASDTVQTIATLWRSGYTCDILAASGYGVQPLYEKDPRQAPFIDGQQQYEYHWSIDLVLQVNFVVTTPQDFASVVTVDPIGVDQVYPTGPAPSPPPNSTADVVVVVPVGVS